MTQLKRIAKFSFWTALLVGAVLLALNFRAAADWWQLRSYSPPPTVSQLASEDTMTPLSRHIFYVNHPQITSDVSQLHQDCPQSEQTIVLGCYHTNQRGIDVFSVSDTRLNGVEEVTAAHEMLHAAWDRLSSKEKNSLSNQLLDYYNHDLNDQRLQNTINDYKKTEPNDVINEMHSVFGTEVANLPANLETYYQRYFSDRPAVVGFSAKYESEFTSRLDQIDAYDARLSSLKSQIQSQEQSLEAQLVQIQSDRAKLDLLRNSDQIDSYNAAISSYNAEVSAYNAALARLRGDIVAYNQLVNQRNAVATELRGLDQSLDTRLTTQPAQ